MDIPLVLRAIGDRKLVYEIPLWYRIMMIAILGILLFALSQSEGTPGLLGWIFLILTVLAAVYEERWTFDAETRQIRHRFGLLFAARSLRLSMDSVSAFRLQPYVRGTLPGSEDEKSENARALAESRGTQSPGDLGLKRRPIFKRPFLTLACESADGAYLLNTVPARRGAVLRLVGSRIADLCGCTLVEG
jgi:hypothetical protein